MEGNCQVNTRDLSKEMKELNILTSQVESFEEEFKRKTEIMRKNYISDITLYLNRQFEELGKFTNEFFMAKYFSIESYVSIRFYKYKDNSIYLFINLKSEKIFKEKSFNIGNPNDPNYPNNIEEYPSLADLLIEHWEEIKNELLIKINQEISDIKEKNEEKLSELQKRLAIYEDFKI